MITLILNACIGLSDGTALPLVDEFETATPTPVGSWETVIEGVIYDMSVEPNRPIRDATVRYIVVHSYFFELQEGRTKETKTDEHGKFYLPVMVHDTDRVRIVVDAQGFVSFEENLVGIELVSGKNFMIELKPLIMTTEDPN